jgi:hypothetical protein
MQASVVPHTSNSKQIVLRVIQPPTQWSMIESFGVLALLDDAWTTKMPQSSSLA